jgi:hypothetical protein
MEHRLDTELDRPDDREEPECWYCDDKGYIEVLVDGFVKEPCPLCQEESDDEIPW